MDETAFETLAGRMIEGLMDRIDEVAGDVLEADIDGGALSVEVPGGGQYLLNKHAPNRELWLSSPKSGAAHFAYDQARAAWIDTRGGGDLMQLLEAELSQAAGRPLGLA